MADAAVTFLLENLKQLMLYQINLISGAENELKLLEEDLGIMKAFLNDASKRRKKEDLFKEWERQIREVVYEVEDVIDDCLTQAAAGAGKNFRNTFGGIKKLNLAREVKSLREGKVKRVFEKARADFVNLQIADAFDTNQEQQIRDKRKKAPRQDNVVGFEDETEKLIGYLNEASEELEVISIIGMPGLGKTTVAWKIYQDPKIQYEFPTLIWINVSQEFNKKDVLLTIMKKFTQQDLSSKSIEELTPMVTESLKIGKCLIFMDDVWTVEVWNEIQSALPKHNKMCKVLITSRDEKVAWSANRSRPPHRLRFLDAAESWMLLQLEVFGKPDGVPSELETVGKIIAGQCGGLPLAIIVIGGVLVEKFSTTGENMTMKRDWEKVSESVGTYLIQEDGEKHMENIISLSYTKLPHELRGCFLYLGMFPEDTEILAWTLTHLWIAEGFVQQKQGKSLEEIAQDNLKDLINRNLVMVDKTKPDGEVKTCRVHDTIREFCKNEAAFGKQNLLQEVKKSKEGVFEPPVQETHKFRRLCIHSYVEDFFLRKPKVKVPKARSFLCFSKAPINLEAKDISSITDAFELIRVFDVNIKFPRFPTNLPKLVHLRYLTLSGDELRILPDAISRLWNLQTLTVHTLSRTLELRADLWKMMQLRHVKTKASIILINVDGGRGEGGENLQTLSRLSPQSCTKNVFNKAKNLNTLGIRGQLATLLDSNCLEKLGRLEKLKLVNDVFPRVAYENPLPGLPHRFPPRVRVLTLSATYLSWTQMSTVGKLGTLEVLKLKDNAFIGNAWEALGGGFHQLGFLYIARTDLKYWTASGDPFPKLRSIVLKNCEKLEGVPFDQLGENLEVLSLERVTKYVVFSAKKIKLAKEQQRSIRGGFKLIIAPGDE